MQRAEVGINDDVRRRVLAVGPFREAAERHFHAGSGDRACARRQAVEVTRRAAEVHQALVPDAHAKILSCLPDYIGLH